VFGYDEITRQYHDRYGLPVMHTETNFDQGHEGNETVDWLWKQWANVLRVRNNRVPIVGFTWYSLTDQIDWDVALRELRGKVNPRGLYDLDRNIRPVGKAFKKLLSQWREVLPTPERLPVCASHAPERVRRAGSGPATRGVAPVLAP
jgi:beta-glucosidase